MLTTAFLVSCKRDKAMWDTDLAAPILEDTLSLGNLVADSLLYTSNGVYTLKLDRSLYKLQLSEVVNIPDTTINHKMGFAISGFTVPPGYQFVNNVEEHDLGLDGVQLKKIRIASGGINVTVLNPLETKAFFTVELPGVTRNGVTLSRNIAVNAGTIQHPGQVQQFVDLSGYDADLTGISGNGFNIMQSRMLVQSDPAGSAVVIQPADSMAFLVTLQNIKLDYAKGYFGHQVFSDTSTQIIEAFQKIASGLIDIPSVSLNFSIKNSLKVAGRFYISMVKNTNAQNSTVSLTGPAIGMWQTINSATGNEYALTTASATYTFDANNSNVEHFLENHGAKVDMGFSVELNPWGNTSGGNDEIFPQSTLEVDLSGDLPLQIGLTDLVIKDTFDFSLSQNVNKSHVTGGTIWLQAINAFPLQGDIDLVLMDASMNPLITLHSADPLASSIYGSLVNGVQQKTSALNFVIPSSVFDDLGNVKHIAVTARLNTPDSSGASVMVQIPENAFISFKAGAKLQLQVVL